MDLGHDAVYPEAVVNGLLSIDRVGCDKVLEFMKSHIQKTGDDKLPFMTTIHGSNIQISRKPRPTQKHRDNPYAEDSGNLVDLGHDTVYPEAVV